LQCAIGQPLTKSNKRNLIAANYGAKFENLEGFECKQIARKLGIAKPCVKRSKIKKQRFYNAKRKEKPHKPQSSLNFQFNFGEEEEMKAMQEGFVRL